MLQNHCKNDFAAFFYSASRAWLKIIPAKYGAHFAEGLFQQTPEQLLPDRNYFNKKDSYIKCKWV